MRHDEKLEFWDLIGKISGDLTDIDWQIIDLIKDGENQTEIAKLLGIHRNTVKYRLNRMKKLIQRKDSFVQF